MSEPLGGRVLVEGDATGPLPTREVHDHPGVPVADLVRECELLWKGMDMDHLLRQPSGRMEGCTTSTTDVIRLVRHEASKLRAARESAAKPKLKPGQEVWVRAQYNERIANFDGVGPGDDVSIRRNGDRGSVAIVAHPDDIRIDDASDYG